jgi:hypothetical protein
MSTRLYTNTSNITGIIGLVVTTVALSYASQNATKIVEGTVNLVKDGIEKGNSMLHEQKKQCAVLGRDAMGKLYDTGKRVWVK